MLELVTLRKNTDWDLKCSLCQFLQHLLSFFHHTPESLRLKSVDLRLVTKKYSSNILILSNFLRFL